MDPTVLLHEDHVKVTSLLDEAAATADLVYKKSLFDQIAQDLMVHTKLEEEFFYPAVRQIESAQARELVDRAEQEHIRIERLLKKMESLDPSDNEFEAQLLELRNDVEQHIREEEDQIFPIAQSSLSRQRLEELGNDMERAKQSFKAREVRPEIGA